MSTEPATPAHAVPTVGLPPSAPVSGRVAAPAPRARARAIAAAALLCALGVALGGARTATAQSPAATNAASAAVPATARLTGVVYDSLARRPLAGAVVQVVQATDLTAARSATSDSLGRFALDGLAPGRYLVGFYHPVLEVLGVDLTPRTLNVTANGPNAAPLAVPGPSVIKAALCGTAAAGDSTGLLVGAVRDADSGTPVAGAAVTITWTEYVFVAGGVRTDRRRVPAPTRETGTYAVCGLPTDGTLLAGAEAPGRASGLVELNVPPRGVLVQEFTLGDSASARLVASDPGETERPAPTHAQPRAVGAAAETPRVARGTARLAGTVRGANARPLRGARVLVWGTGLSTTTDEEGRFVLGDLPAGTYSVEARAVGLEPRRTPVALASGRTAAVTLTLDARINTLAVVTVLGKRSRSARGITEFVERKRTGLGRYITADDIAQQHPLDLTDVLRTTPGLRVLPASRIGYAVRGRGNCVPAVVLDGMPISEGADELDQLVRPQDVLGIEVYTGIGTVPSQYGGLMANGCGAVLVWTKR